MGRRRAKNDQRFFYDGYLQVADNGGGTYVWDCMESIATRPLAWTHFLDVEERSVDSSVTQHFFYTHDGNKNVSEVIVPSGTADAHYEYSPFGAVILQSGGFAATNLLRFSSEYVDNDVAAMYYNYRSLDSLTGRWIVFDFIEEHGGLNLYAFVRNDALGQYDVLGNRRSNLPGIILDGLCEDAYNYAKGRLETAQEIRAWDRYTNHGARGRSRDIELTSTEVKEIAESIGDVVAFVDSKRRACKGTLTVSDSNSIGGAAPRPWVGAIGGVSIRVVTHCSNGCFSFEYHINDLYDFDIKGFDTSRTITGELKTIMVNWTQFCLQCDWESFYHKGSYYGE